MEAKRKLGPKPCLSRTWTMRLLILSSELFSDGEQGYQLPIYTGAMKCTGCKNFTADRFGDHTLRCENKIQRHNFVSARLKKVFQSCGYKVTNEEGCSVHDRNRPGDLLVWNWKPGVNLYIDVSVIDPTAQA